MHENEIGTIIIQAAYDVHKNLGPGLLESTYQACLEYQVRDYGLYVQSQVPLPVVYKDVKLDCGYRIDLWVEHKVIIEIKSVEALHDVHLAQILTYLKLSDAKLGYLINFNVPKVKQGIRRVVNKL